MKVKRIYENWLGLIVLSFFVFHFSLCSAHIGMKELGDSLTAYTGFSPVWSPSVRVKQLRVNGNKVTVYTNFVLKDVRWTPENVNDLKRRVSRWVLGHENGKIAIHSANTEIETLITACAKARPSDIKCHATSGSYCDLTERNIVLYPSHGLYFNKDRNEWIWQRATLWTTVEDLYSQEYVRLVKQMLENAGAIVLSPRPGLEQHENGVTGMPMWAEGARYWLKHQGVDSTLWNLYDGDEYKDDMKCRAMWVNSLDTKIDLCIALHTDGFDSGNDSTIIGTLCIYTAKDDEGKTRLRDGRDREKTNRNLADWIQTQITKDLQTIEPAWTRRQLKEANYCESRVPVVPSIILELLSHKNMADMQYGLNPQFRFAAARAVYKGIVRYLNGIDAAIQPLPVQDLGVFPANDNGSPLTVNLRWKPVTDTLEHNAAPLYYMVYIQTDNGEWDVQQVENATELKVELKQGVPYSFYVVAGNEGGLSLPSPTVSACLPAENEYPTALIVDAFNDTYGPEWFIDSTYAGIVPGTYACEDRFSCAYIGEQWNYRKSDPWVNDDNCGFGACYRDHAGQLTIGNTRDYTVQHGRILRQMNISYVSCTAGMLTPVSRFQLVDFICGRQRNPMTAEHYRLIADYLNAGGKLLLSTDHFSAIDQAWAKKQLHASFYAAQATHSGRILVSGHKPYQLLMQPNDHQLFTHAPQALKHESDAMPLAKYMDMRCTAAVGYKSPTTATLVFGFPLETVQDFDHIYRHAIQWLREL